MKKVLVTGAAGFIGSHLVDKLLEESCYVVGLDHLDEPGNNLTNALKSSRFKYIARDLNDTPSEIRKLGFKLDYIFHFGAIVGVQNYLSNSLEMFNSNILGSYQIVNYALEEDIPIFFASTSEIYGKNLSIPWDENSDRVLGNTSLDRWSYSSGKAVIEHLLFSLGKEKKLRFNIARFFNVYGPRQKPIFVVSRALSRAFRNLPLENFDGGNQTRSFIYISDAIEAVFRISNSNKFGDAYNIGTTDEITIANLLQIICKSFPKSNISNTETTKSHGIGYEDLQRRVPINSKLVTQMNWNPKVDLESGIKKTISWINTNEWWLNINSEKIKS